MLAEINQLDINLGRAVEAYDAATVKLDHIRKELSLNAYERTGCEGQPEGTPKAVSPRGSAISTSPATATRRSRCSSGRRAWTT